MAEQACQEVTVSPDLQVKWDQPDRLVQMGILDRKGHREQARSRSKERREKKGQQDHLDQQATKDHLEKMEQKAKGESRVHRDLQDQQEKRATQELLDQLASQAGRAPMANIVHAQRDNQNLLVMLAAKARAVVRLLLPKVELEQQARALHLWVAHQQLIRNLLQLHRPQDSYLVEVSLEPDLLIHRPPFHSHQQAPDLLLLAHLLIHQPPFHSHQQAHHQ